MRISRRQLVLGSVAFAMVGTPATGVGAHAPDLSVGATIRAAPSQTVIGRSQGGQPLVVFHIGGGRHRVLAIGGQHGAPEANAVWFADALLGHFTLRPDDVPRGLGLDILTVANPDGFIWGTRRFLSGIDPNRNWDTTDWQPDAYDSLGQLWLGLGGPAPMSEPETVALAAWISRYRPILVVNYHSAGGFVATGHSRGIDLAYAYALAAGYPYFGPDQEPFDYPITGAMDGWLARLSIPDIFVELTTADDPEVEENLAGLRAVLQLLAL